MKKLATSTGRRSTSDLNVKPKGRRMSIPGSRNGIALMIPKPDITKPERIEMVAILNPLISCLTFDIV